MFQPILDPRPSHIWGAGGGPRARQRLTCYIFTQLPRAGRQCMIGREVGCYHESLVPVLPTDIIVKLVQCGKSIRSF